ncbi:hypothetical protein Q5741_19905 [Paenibacillus sp. JX-17]|uniref:DNA topology modulation protein FlaR n=1 Tax=Paenibacillus lacisoli TaxID=3064525 RepID=A0ABT9CH94_9BACL|nr:hypothetical protein [Paenibacillus sp. JX-17]MDO7908657.1 hypothetical protein [Paenibacillus sp. JX-17]
MNKVLIIGIVASGKTTLAQHLSLSTGIPWFELDSIVHHQIESIRIKRTADEQAEVISHIDRQGAWIMEGTDRASYQFLYDMADIIIFLDPLLWKRKLRIFTRYLKQKLGIEPCHYKPDLKMLRLMYQWTRDFEQNRPAFEYKLRSYGLKVIRLTDNRPSRSDKLLRRP